MDSDLDDEINTQKHKQLVDKILNLNTGQYVNKPTRTEPISQISEFNLIKSLKDTKDTVRLHDLTKALKNRTVNIELRKKVKKAEVKSKTLVKPLEKPQAERIRRSTAYEHTKKQLERWDPVVTSNRVSTNLVFPLRNPSFDYKEANDFTSNWVLKSNLESELNKLEQKVETFDVETDTNFPMTLKEMILKRKEMAKLRRFQNYKEVKARLQNKIKSKKFRKILRKEKIKQQLKEFETLQKTNPEEALKKLEEIEKARAEERASLRHKSTGKWARNQQIRAKYDKESRKVLADQLSISKDLMQKQQLSESSGSDEDSDTNIANSHTGENPWVNEVKPSKEIEEFVNGYKKFWESRNLINSTETLKDNDNAEDAYMTHNKIVENDEQIPQESVIEKKLRIAERKKGSLADKSSKQRRNKKIKEKKKLAMDTASVIWEVTSLNKENEIIVDDIFDNIEYKMQNKVDNKFKKVKLQLENKTVPQKKKKLTLKSNVKCKNSKQDKLTVVKKGKSILNEEQSAKVEVNSIESSRKDIESLKVILESQPLKPTKVNKCTKSEKVTVAKPVSLDSCIPDVLSHDDNEMTDRCAIIAEAFEDIDIAEEFAEDKEHEIDKGKPSDINLSLPGWGSWGGQSIPISNRRKKRFIMKLPKQFPRKDMNKGNLIINESANDNIKPHLVSEVPFPFKTVKDFEASVRAPIGNTFVPETAFRKMIKPTLKTKMGAIIEPITEDILLHKKKRK